MMTTPSPDTIRRRLERAGYVHIAGWVPASYAQRAEAQIDSHREEVERIAADPPRRRGRPRKDA